MSKEDKIGNLMIIERIMLYFRRFYEDEIIGKPILS